MALKFAEVTITAEGRDQHKKFILTEMPADQAERWALRALLLAAQSGAEVESNIGGGMAGLVTVGLQTIIGGVRWADVEPLLTEMFECVQIQAGPIVRKLVPGDIEEVATRIRLRAEVLTLHTGFSFADVLLKSADGTPAKPRGSPSTGTSPP